MLRDLSIFSGLIPIIIFILFLKRNKYRGLWVVFFYCCISFITDNSLHKLPEFRKFYIFSSFTVIEYSLFSLFLYLSLKEKVFKYILIFFSIIFYIIAAWGFTNKIIESFDSISASLEASLIILYCIFFLYERINDPAVTYIYYSKEFWIIIAFLLYLSSTLFLFIYAAALTKQEYRDFWSINNIFDILKNLLFSIAFFMKKSQNRLFSLKKPYSSDMT